jgi:hypothetical protein
VSGLGVSSEWLTSRGLGDIFRDIAGDTSRNKRDRVSRLLLKAIRSLPEREQDAVLAYLVDRSLAPDPMATRHEYTGALHLERSLEPTFHGAQIRWDPSTSFGMRDAALILRRLGAGATVEDLARLLGLEPDRLNLVLHDLAKRRYESDRLGKIFQGLADGKSTAQLAVELGVTESELADELGPSERLTSIVCAVLRARAVFGSPSGAVGTSGPLRTMPVRFPEHQYQRLKAWCEEHKFPMAVVVRGLVDRFLDEQQPAP